MSTPHIQAKKGEIAERVLLPGDPLRAKLIAQKFLVNPICYNEVRGALGFTGKYNGVDVSIQATGMGQPSMSIYATELFCEYEVKRAIRVGTAGALKEQIAIKSLVLAMSCCTDSNMNLHFFNGFSYAPTACFNLLKLAYDNANKKNVPCSVGQIVTSDFFYDETDRWKMWANYGVLAVEMESAVFYTIAAKYGVEALSILTVSDNLVTGEITSSKERENSFLDMMSLALDSITS